MLMFTQSTRQLPTAQWGGAVAVVGDASGGNATADIQLRKNDVAFLASIEEVDFESPVASSPTLAYGMTGGVVGALNRQPDLASVIGGVQRAFWKVPAFAAMSVMFGDDNSVQSVLRVTVPNPGVGQTATVRAWGYTWHRESQQVPGGPSRPSGTGFVGSALAPGGA
jgi:hypothetical protein